MRLLASLVIAGFGAAVLPASAVPPVPAGASDPWRVIAVDGLEPRRVGLAHRRRGLLSTPAAAVRDLLVEVVAAGVAERLDCTPPGPRDPPPERVASTPCPSP
jgi:DNA-binding transcriptional LysR family regulator